MNRIKRLRMLVLPAAIAACSAVGAEEGAAPPPAERADALRREAQQIRDAADRRFEADSKACYRKFLVNACLDDARMQRVDALTEARRREDEARGIERELRQRQRAEQQARHAEEAARREAEVAERRQRFQEEEAEKARGRAEQVADKERQAEAGRARREAEDAERSRKRAEREKAKER